MVTKDALRDALASVLAGLTHAEFETGIDTLYTALPAHAIRRPAPVGWRYLDETSAAEAFEGAAPDALYREEAELALIASSTPEGEWRAEAYLGDYGYAVTAETREAALTPLLALADALYEADRRDSGDFTAVARSVGFVEICGPSQARPSPLG